MKSARWLVLGGAVAGFLGVLGLHRPGCIRRAAAGPGERRQPGPQRPAAGPPGHRHRPGRGVRVRRTGHPGRPQPRPDHRGERAGAPDGRAVLPGTGRPGHPDAAQRGAGGPVGPDPGGVRGHLHQRGLRAVGPGRAGQGARQRCTAGWPGHPRRAGDGHGGLVRAAPRGAARPGPAGRAPGRLRRAARRRRGVQHLESGQPAEPAAPRRAAHRPAPPVMAEVRGRLPAGPGRVRRLVRPVGHARRLRPHRAGQGLGGG